MKISQMAGRWPSKPGAQKTDLSWGIFSFQSLSGQAGFSSQPGLDLKESPPALDILTKAGVWM